MGAPRPAVPGETGATWPARGRAWGEAPFVLTAGVVFVGSAVGTVGWCGSMSGGMSMPGGWTMAMAWMRMPGQTWAGAAAEFMGMWVLMMVAMMLPSLVPMLSQYRRAVRGQAGAAIGCHTVVVAMAYFCVWTAFGVVAYPAGLGIVAAAMRWPTLSRAVPAATGAALVVAGVVQLSAWKARQLARCRSAPGCRPARLAGATGAWRHGLELGTHCGRCCSGLMLVLLVTGVMDPGTMGVVAAAITAERLAPWPERVARLVGVVVAAAGVIVIARVAASGGLVALHGHEHDAAPASAGGPPCSGTRGSRRRCTAA